MIKTLKARGLNQKLDLDLLFHEDLNILTGRNGSGKTTVLKLLWYMISGNCEHIFSELSLDEAELVTDSFTLSVRTTTTKRPTKGPVAEWHLKPNNGEPVSATTDLRLSPSRSYNQINVKILQLSNRSLFFPTFRRIEGGFSIGREREGEAPFYYGPSIEQAISSVAQKMSVKNHHFIASISTADIVQTLTQHYANISEQVNEDHRTLSQEIATTIGDYEKLASANSDQANRLEMANDILGKISRLTTIHSAQQEGMLRPFTALSELIAKIFHHKGIKMTSRITLGDATEAIDSTNLSAGEKQMLSFLAYNAFEQDSTIFIDEPEISLHTDWQRTLFPTLFAQGTKNQFIVATHSPFMYAKFADKELLLGTDRGD